MVKINIKCNSCGAELEWDKSGLVEMFSRWQESPIAVVDCDVDIKVEPCQSCYSKGLDFLGKVFKI